MTCSIERNNNGDIVGVNTPDGVKSVLFDEIHSNVFLSTPEVSVQIMSHAYSESVSKMFEKQERGGEYVYENGEPRVFYKDDRGNIHNTLESTILKGSGKIEFGFKNPKDNSLIKIASVDTNSSPKSKFIASQVQEGVLSPYRVLGKDGVTRMQGKGEFTETRVGLARVFANNAAIELGAGNVKIRKDGTIDDNIQNDDVAVVSFKDGRKEVMSWDDVFKIDNADNVDGFPSLVVAAMIKTGRVYNETQSSDSGISNEVKSLSIKLNNFLKSLGFSVTTLEAYRKRYNTVYGQDPDINAIADIANKVVAFADGKLSIENLSEEVAHIAIEAFNDQNSIDDALKLVENTPEYSMHKDYYTEKYKDFYEGEELDRHVKKEILGKILANQLIEGFRTENKNEKSASLIEFLKDLWNRFSSFIKGRVTNKQRRELDNILNTISNSLLSEDMSVFNQIEGNEDFFYSASTGRSRSIEKDLKSVRDDILRSLRNADTQGFDRKVLNNLYDSYIENDTLAATNKLLGVVQKSITSIEKQLLFSQRNGTPIPYSIIMLHDGMSSYVKDSLIELKKSLERGISNGIFTSSKSVKLAKDYIAQIESISNKISNITPEIKEQAKDITDSAIKNVKSEMNLNDETEAMIDAEFDSVNKDISAFAKLFMPSTFTNNPFFKAMVFKIASMKIKVNNMLKDRVEPLLTKILENNWAKYESNLFLRDKNGKRTYYYNSMYDLAQRDQDIFDFSVAEAARILGEEVEKIERLARTKEFSEIIKDEDKLIEFNNNVREFEKNSANERAMKDEYYDSSDDRFNRAKVSSDTISILRNFSAEVGSVTSKVKDNRGRPDMSKLSEEDWVTINDVKTSKQRAKSAYDRNGEIKEGLRAVRKDQMTDADYQFLEDEYGITRDLIENYKGEIILLEQGYTQDMLGIEARTSYDLNLLDMLYREKQIKEGKGKPHKDYLNTIAELESNGLNAFDWAIMNGVITLSEEYFEEMSGFKSFIEKVQNQIDTIDDDDAKIRFQNELDYYKTLYRKQNLILRENKQHGSTIEVDGANMSTDERKTLLLLEDELRSLRASIVSKMPEGSMAGTINETSVKELNDSYYKALKESGLSAYDFAISRNHISDYSKRKLERFASQFTAFIKGNATYMDAGFEEFFSDLVDHGLLEAEVDSNDEIINKDEIIRNAIDYYAQSLAPSYFTRFAPQGYDELMEALKKSPNEDGFLSTLDFINKTGDYNNFEAARYLEIRPDFAWTDEVSSEDLKNPYYKQGGYYVKPNRKYLRDEWFNYFGISKQQFLDSERGDLEEMTPTKNVEEYEFLKEMIRMRSDTLENYGDSNFVDKWMLPQKSKSAFEKVFSTENFTSGTSIKASAKDLLKDIVMDRPDEQEYGQMESGNSLIESGIKSVPKYFQQKLEDPEAITENMIDATIVDYKNSLLYKERKRNERDLQGLQWGIENQKLKRSGVGGRAKIIKDGATSNIAQKASEFLEFHLYGIKQNRRFKANAFGREIDFTRMISSLHSFARFNNLGFNLFVDATGAVTGALNKAIDNAVGDYYSLSSAHRGNTVWLSLLPEYAADFEKMGKKSKLRSLMETFGISDFAERTDESSKGWLGRVGKRSPYIFSDISNKSLYPRTLLTVLSDFRFHNGQFVSDSDFRMLNKDLSVNEQKSMWGNISNDSLYDNLEFKDGAILPNEKFYSKFATKEDADKHFSILKSVIGNKVRHIGEMQDGVLNEIDQTMAQRDVLVNTLLTHRGWALINVSRKFRNRSFNYMTGKAEEGHWRSLFKLLNGMRKGIDADKESFGNRFQDAWMALEDDQKKNVKRAGIEASVYGALMMIGGMLFYGDDGDGDDDLWLSKFAELIFIRTTSEFASSQPFSFPSAASEIVDSPFPGWKTYKLLFPNYIYGLTEYDKDYGNKYFKDIMKGTALRRYGQYADIQKQIDGYRYFNNPTLWLLGSKKTKYVWDSWTENEGKIK